MCGRGCWGSSGRERSRQTAAVAPVTEVAAPLGHSWWEGLARAFSSKQQWNGMPADQSPPSPPPSHLCPSHSLSTVAQSPHLLPGPNDPPVKGLQYQTLCAGEIEALLAGQRGVVMVQLWVGWDAAAPQPVYNCLVLEGLRRALARRDVSIFISKAAGELGAVEKRACCTMVLHRQLVVTGGWMMGTSAFSSARRQVGVGGSASFWHVGRERGGHLGLGRRGWHSAVLSSRVVAC